MATKVFFWPGTVYYSDEDMGDLWEALFIGGNAANEGVLKHPVSGPSSLFASISTSSPVAVAAGWAVTKKGVVHVDASTDVAVPSPTNDTRKDRIVLRVAWDAKTATVERVAGAEGGDFPTVTQTDTDTWDMPLWGVAITTAGVITLTDERTFVHGSFEVHADSIPDGLIDGDHIADDAVDSQHIVDASVDLAHMSVNSVDSDQYVDGSIDRVHLAADIVDGTKIADDVVDSEHIVAGAVDLEHMSANSVDSDQYVNLSVDREHLASDIIDGTKLADSAVDSEHIVAGAIDLAHMSVNSIDSNQYVDGSIDREHLAADIINGTKIADDSINSEHYAAGSIDREHLAADIVDGTIIADDSVNSEHYVADSVDAEHIGTMIPVLSGRQGGSATIWGVQGTTNYTSGLNVRVQVGTVLVTASPGYASVTFPVAFPFAPLLFVTPGAYAGGPRRHVMLSAISASAFTVYATDASDAPADTQVNWLAIGPE